MENASVASKPSHLSVVSPANDTAALLSRAQVAERIGASVATVRRYEGTLLHPHVDKDGTHRFDPKEVTALAASRANQALDRGTIRNAKPVVPEARTRRECHGRRDHATVRAGQLPDHSVWIRSSWRTLGVASRGSRVNASKDSDPALGFGAAHLRKSSR